MLPLQQQHLGTATSNGLTDNSQAWASGMTSMLFSGVLGTAVASIIVYVVTKPRPFSPGDELHIPSGTTVRITRLIWGPSPRYQVYEAQHMGTGELLALKWGFWSREEWEREWDALKAMEDAEHFPRGIYLSPP